MNNRKLKKLNTDLLQSGFVGRNFQKASKPQSTSEEDNKNPVLTVLLLNVNGTTDKLFSKNRDYQQEILK